MKVTLKSTNNPSKTYPIVLSEAEGKLFITHDGKIIATLIAETMWGPSDGPVVSEEDWENSTGFFLVYHPTERGHDKDIADVYIDKVTNE